MLVLRRKNRVTCSLCLLAAMRYGILPDVARSGTNLIVVAAWCCEAACALADDVVGVMRVASETNSEATVERSFIPFGDGAVPMFLLGMFLGGRQGEA